MHGVIFDMDGVLVLTGPAHYEAWRTAAAADGIDLSYETFSHTFGRTNADTIRMIWGRELPAARVAEIAGAKERHFRSIAQRDLPMAPGLMPLLESLAARGVAMAVGSSAPRENIEMILNQGQIRSFFRAVVDGSQVQRGKPAPDVFLLAARGIGIEPTRCAVLEDAPAGILAAIAAGMTPIGIATTHPRGDLSMAGAREVFRDLASIGPEQLLNLIDQQARV
jgi:beta-phosphoglucomutase